MPPIKWYKTCVVCGVRSCRNENVRRRFMAKFPLDEDRYLLLRRNKQNSVAYLDKTLLISGYNLLLSV